MSKPKIVYPSTSRGQTRIPNFKLNVKVKSNPPKLKHLEEEIQQGQSHSPNPGTNLKVKDQEVLVELELMISQLQYNIFNQKCASDSNLALKPRDLDMMLKTDFWKDCCNYTIHIAISFARYLQRIRDTRPRVNFQLKNRNSRSTDEGQSMALTSKEIDIGQVGSCLHELQKLIKKHYEAASAAETTSSSLSKTMSFHKRKSARVLSSSLPRNLPSSRVTDEESIQGYSKGYRHQQPKSVTPNDLKLVLTSILNILSRDENSFPQGTGPDLEMQEVQIEPRTPGTSVPNTRQNSITAFINNYYNSRPSFSNSDLEWSSISATDVDTESEHAPETPITTSASVSATSIQSQKENEGSFQPVTNGGPGHSSNSKMKSELNSGASIRWKQVSVVEPRLRFPRYRYGDNSV